MGQSSGSNTQSLDYQAKPVPAPASKTDIGTLHYTRGGLTNVFFWMLWGDFCLNLMDNGLQYNLIPLQLEKYGMSKAMIGLITGTIIEILSIVMVVIVSTWSDRHRGPLGRRMPFMLYTAPLIALFLIAMGFSPQIGNYLKATAPGLFGVISASSLILALMSITMIGYRFFDMFPQCVYWYLFADVIPPGVIGLFVSLMRVCSTGGVLFFNYFLMKHADDRPSMICTVAGSLYLVSFVLLSVMVKEGEYPPPPPKPQGSPLERLGKTLEGYIRDCYSMNFYWKYYILGFFWMCTMQSFMKFTVFYGKQVTNGNLDQLGKINAMRDGIQMCAFFVIGPIIDKFHPLRAGLVGYVMSMAAVTASWFLIHDAHTYAIFITMTFAALALMQGAYTALPARILPREKYGQFCSANSLLWHLGLIVAMPALGALMDHYGNKVVFGWFLGMSVVGISAMYLLFLDWKERGGDDHYVPPMPPDSIDQADAVA